MTTFIRVADKITGAKYTIPDVTLDPERHTVTDEPAVDAHDQPLAATYPEQTPETPPARTKKETPNA